MPRGRPRKSIGEHKQSGTYRPERHDQIAGSMPPANGKPVRPKRLSKDQAYCWRHACQDWMGEQDTEELILLCEAWEQTRIHETGSSKYHAAVDKFLRLGAKLGMSPADRSSIKLDKTPVKDEDDKFFGMVG